MYVAQPIQVPKLSPNCAKDSCDRLTSRGISTDSSREKLTSRKQNDHLFTSFNQFCRNVSKCFEIKLFHADKKMYINIERSYLPFCLPLMSTSFALLPVPIINVVTKIKIYQLLKHLKKNYI